MSQTYYLEPFKINVAAPAVGRSLACMLDFEALPRDKLQVIAPGNLLRAELLLAQYKVVPENSTRLASVLARPNCLRPATWSDFETQRNAAPKRLGIAPCRDEPQWCAISAQLKADAPPHLHGTVPCKLQEDCALGSLKFFRAPSASAPQHAVNLSFSCLRNKRIVILGDSTLREVVSEMVLWLAADDARFLFDYLSTNFKELKNEPRSLESSSLRVRIAGKGGMHMRIFDSRLNLTVMFEYTGHHAAGKHFLGHRTVSHRGFRGRMKELGLLPDTPVKKRPHILITGNNFHDCLTFSEVCDRRCRCGIGWQQSLDLYSGYARKFAKIVEGVRERGTRVIFNTLYPRDSMGVHGKHDFLRATADWIMAEALRKEGFFFKPNAVINNQWPLFESYFSLSNLLVADFSFNSIHFAPISNRDSLALPDIPALRLQILLNYACFPAFNMSCRHDEQGLSFMAQAKFAMSRQADCSCGLMTMCKDDKRTFLCNSSNPLVNLVSNAASLVLARED